MKNVHEIMKEAGLTRQGVNYRIRQIESSGIPLPCTYGKFGLLQFEDEVADKIINYVSKKPGVKNQKWMIKEK